MKVDLKRMMSCFALMTLLAGVACDKDKDDNKKKDDKKSTTSDDLAKSQKEAEDAKAELARINKELTEIKATPAGQASAKAKELEAKTKELTAQVEEKEKALAKAKTATGTNSQEAEVLAFLATHQKSATSAEETFNEEKAVVQGEIDLHKNEIEQLKTAATGYQAQIATLNDEAKILQEKPNQIEADLEKAKAENKLTPELTPVYENVKAYNAASAKLSEMQQQLAAKKAEQTKSKSDLENKKALVAALKSLSEKTTANIDALTKEIQASTDKAKIEKASSDLDEAKEVLMEYGTQLGLAEKSVADLEAANTTIDTAVTESETAVQTQQTAVNEFMANMSQDLKVVAEEQGRVREKLATLTTESANNSADLTRHQEELSKSEARLVKLQQLQDTFKSHMVQK